MKDLRKLNGAVDKSQWICKSSSIIHFVRIIWNPTPSMTVFIAGRHAGACVYDSYFLKLAID